MSIRSILVHVDKSRHAAQRIAVAARLAVAENAHLIGSAMTGISRYFYKDSTFGIADSTVSNYVASCNEHAKQALAEFENIAKSIGVLSCESRLIDDDPEAGLVLQARYSDLVIVSQTDLDDSYSRVFADLPEFVMLNSTRPLLVIPYAGKFEQIGSDVIVAWDGSMEATRAITSSMGLLRKAERVTVVVFNSSQCFEIHGEQPGADIALYLARHGVKVDVLQQTTQLDIGNALLSLTADMNVNLIVMGGFAHARFREMLVGGVTRTMLKTMTVPVILSH
jgi:nucleotide-binding universal stress UspA family protein